MKKLLPKLNQKGATQLFVLLILLLGIGITVYLIVTGNLKLFSRASNPQLSPEVEALIKPIAYYDMENIQNNQVKDVGSNQYHASLVNAEKVTGKYGDGVNFNQNYSLLQLDNFPVFKNALAFTFASWVYFDKKAPERYIAWANGVDFRIGYQRIAFGLMSNGGFGVYRLTPGLLPRDVLGKVIPNTKVTQGDLDGGKWKHIAFTYDGNIQKIYIDGVLISKLVDSSGNVVEEGQIISYAPNKVSDKLIIGRANIDDTQFKGILDDIKIYDRALVESEIRQIMQQTIQVSPIPNVSPSPTVAVVELENPQSIAEIAKVVSREFYKNHEDRYDFLGIFFNYNRRQYSHYTVKNNVTGIGSQNWYLENGIPKLDPNPIFDQTVEYGSQGRLLGIGVMGSIMDQIETNSKRAAWIEEVIGHQFGVFVGSPYIASDPLHLNSDESDGHWNNCMHFSRTNMTQPYWNANLWRDNGDGTWTRIDGKVNDLSKPAKFDPFMLYFMGFIPAERVPNVILLEPDGGFKSGLCGSGKTIKATPREISIQDIIQKYGHRTPSYENSQKAFSTAFILVTEKGIQPSQAVLQKLAEFEAQFQEDVRYAVTYP